MTQSTHPLHPAPPGNLGLPDHQNRSTGKDLTLIAPSLGGIFPGQIGAVNTPTNLALSSSSEHNSPSQPVEPDQHNFNQTPTHSSQQQSTLGTLNSPVQAKNQTLGSPDLELLKSRLNSLSLPSDTPSQALPPIEDEIQTPDNTLLGPQNPLQIAPLIPDKTSSLDLNPELFRPIDAHDSSKEQTSFSHQAHLIDQYSALQDLQPTPIQTPSPNLQPSLNTLQPQHEESSQFFQPSPQPVTAFEPPQNLTPPQLDGTDLEATSPTQASEPSSVPNQLSLPAQQNNFPQQIPQPKPESLESETPSEKQPGSVLASLTAGVIRILGKLKTPEIVGKNVNASTAQSTLNDLRQGTQEQKSTLKV